MNAAKEKSLSPAGLTALRVLLLLVVALFLPQTRVWGFDDSPHPASGQIAVASASAVGEIAPGIAYDASGSLVAGEGAVTSQAPLLLEQGSTVPNAGGVIRSFIQETDQTYYRVFSRNQQGAFLTAVKPQSSAWAQQALALPPGNSAEFIQEVLVPSGTRLQRSRALPAFGGQGGAEQFQLLDLIPKENFREGRPF